MTQQANSQEWARNRVHRGHIVDRWDDLETAYEQIHARCYNRKKDGSLGYWKHSSFTHHDFEVMRRLTCDGGYLLTHFLEAVGLTKFVDPPKKPDDVTEATHQKALKQARESLWGTLTSDDYILRDFIQEQFAECYDSELADLTAEDKRAARQFRAASTNAPGMLSLGLFFCRRSRRCIDRHL